LTFFFGLVNLFATSHAHGRHKIFSMLLKLLASYS